MVGTIYLLIGEFSNLFWHVQDSDMCISRAGKSSKVTHSVVRNSCFSLSDAESTVVDSDDEESSHSGSKAGSPNCQSKESKQKLSKPFKTSKALKVNAGFQNVSEPKHMGAKCFTGESRDSISVFDELKRKFDEIKRKVSPATHS